MTHSRLRQGFYGAKGKLGIVVWYTPVGALIEVTVDRNIGLSKRRASRSKRTAEGGPSVAGEHWRDYGTIVRTEQPDALLQRGQAIAPVIGYAEGIFVNVVECQAMMLRRSRPGDHTEQTDGRLSKLCSEDAA